jgi:hypothetical protein
MKETAKYLAVLHALEIFAIYAVENVYLANISVLVT